MASRRQRRIEDAVRELCLAFPDAEEFESHGSPNFRARKGKIFAAWALNHHGDGHVGLWLATPKLEQSRLLASSKHLYKPPYVGPYGWIGVELNKGVSWKLVTDLVAMAYANSSPPKLVATMKKAPAVAAPTAKMKPEEIDRLKAPKALKAIAAIRRIVSKLPETSEGEQWGGGSWLAGKKTFATLHDYGKGLAVHFWTGIERQGPLSLDPRLHIPKYSGNKGWMALDLEQGLPVRELEDWLTESWRHFASRRALKIFDGVA
ncbi:MAG TPA: MmcQ/YjbR family DNA-binding protein [Steroidobacteraceae bacterium]|nr:MmcQ/YjbR family DNA-binding protein [Steroidobacteraceae bacterium]